MLIRMAKIEDFEDVMQFYYDLIDAMQNAEFHPGWEKDIYPTKQFIQDSIECSELSIAIIDDTIVSAMVMNHDCEDGYDKIQWKVNASKNEVVVIHALGILPYYQGKGIAKKMVAYAIDTCKEKA